MAFDHCFYRALGGSTERKNQSQHFEFLWNGNFKFRSFVDVFLAISIWEFVHRVVSHALRNWIWFFSNSEQLFAFNQWAQGKGSFSQWHDVNGTAHWNDDWRCYRHSVHQCLARPWFFMVSSFCRCRCCAGVYNQFFPFEIYQAVVLNVDRFSIFKTD